MTIIKLNQKIRRVEIKDFEIENEIVFNFFDKLPAAEREDRLLKAIYFGVLAQMEDRLSAFLAKTSNELGTELESLKMIFEMKQELFYKTTIKGKLAEEEIAAFLNDFVLSKRLKDNIYLTGNKAGELPRNKTGDIVSEIEGNLDLKIAIECKFDKSIKLGEIENKDVFTKKMETSWNQLLEAQANRDSKVSLIVFDLSLIDNSILQRVDNVGYIPEVGFIAIINSQKGDYTNLGIAYMLARDIVINSKDVELDQNVLSIIVSRIIKDINTILDIKKIVESNIENNRNILRQLEKGLLLMQFNKDYLTKFLKDGKLNKKDLLDFYMAEEVKDKYKAIEIDIKNIS